MAYGGDKEYSCGIYVDNECEYEVYPETCKAKDLRDDERYIRDGNIDLEKEILDAVGSAITGESTQEQEFSRVKKALVHMWFPYVNKDEYSPHDFEVSAEKEAQEILGPWKECIEKYMGERMIKSES